jgi:hypothetical protein
VSGALFAVGHHLLYGAMTPYATGDQFVGGELTVIGTSPDYLARSQRLVGLFVDRNWGLAAWQPAWLLVLPALGAVLRRRPPWWPAVVLPLLAGWAVATWTALTMHGFWWSGRQTVVVLPMAVLLVAWWAGRSWLVGGLVLGATTWSWLVVDGLRHRITWVVHVTTTGAPVHRLLAPLLPDMRLPQALDWARFTAWCAVAVALLVWGFLARRDEDAGPGEGADADRAVLDLHGDRAVG